MIINIEYRGSSLYIYNCKNCLLHYSRSYCNIVNWFIIPVFLLGSDYLLSLHNHYLPYSCCTTITRDSKTFLNPVNIEDFLMSNNFTHSTIKENLNIVKRAFRFHNNYFVLELH